jgi:hypothetical protein
LEASFAIAGDNFRRRVNSAAAGSLEAAEGLNAFRLEMRFAMDETPKLSVEKALKKLRGADAPKSRNARRTEEMNALDDEIKRMTPQRLRLDRHQRRSTERD